MPGSSGRAQRADARRSIAAILDAAAEEFRADQHVTMAQLARAAGVGRVTLYAHFPTREELLDAVLEQVIDEANTVLDSLALEGKSASAALSELIATSWHLVDRNRRLLAVGLKLLSPNRVREHHDDALLRVNELIARGRSDGEFRTDLPLEWLVTTFYSLLHAAADEVDHHRLTAEEAPSVVEATLLAAFAPPEA